MNKLLAVVLLVALMVLAALPVAADSPIPDYYFVDVEGSCWLPDGVAAPTHAAGTSTAFRMEKPNFLVLTCRGKLPTGAVAPREITKVNYASSGLACLGKMKDTTRHTTNYGAIVYPAGWSEITCRFDLSAQDP